MLPPMYCNYSVYNLRSVRVRIGPGCRNTVNVWRKIKLPAMLALYLLVLGVLADDHDFAIALDDLALFADGLD